MRNSEREDGGRITARLLTFADFVEDQAPLYTRILRATADDPAVLDVLFHAEYGQPPANIVLAAVQYLLLGGDGPELAAWYPVLGAGEPEGDPAALFREFVVEHRDALIDLVSARTVQTNEVRRCVALVPSFATVARQVGEPLALLEIGPSAGLNLLFDRYRYDYGDQGMTGPAHSPLTLTTEVRGGEPPVPDPLPAVAWRRGIDLHPVDLTDPDAVRWARSLLWPEQMERTERFLAAVEIAAPHPPPLVKGDAIDLLPETIAQVPEGCSLVVYHSFALNQFSPGAREEVDALLREASRHRRIDRIGIEMLSPDAPYADVLHTMYRGGKAGDTTIGAAHHHGAWIRWN
jgi:hypothetical protein